MTKFPSVCIIIPTRNRFKSLSETLSSLEGLDYPKNKIEIVIIDNASDQKIKHQKVKIIRNETNNGFAPALNQGIKVTQSKYLWITNDDVLFDRKCLFELIKLAESNEKIGVVAGKMFFRDNPKRMAFSGFRVNFWLGYHPYDSSGKNAVRDIDVATGGCMLIKRSILGKVGLFDEKYFFCGEDYDFCFRTRYAGYKVMYTPYAKVWHGFLGSGKKTFDSLLNHYYGKFRFIFTHATIAQILFFLPAQLITSPTPPVFISLFKNLKEIKNLYKKRKRIQNLKKDYEN